MDFPRANLFDVGDDSPLYDEEEGEWRRLWNREKNVPVDACLVSLWCQCIFEEESWNYNRKCVWMFSSVLLIRNIIHIILWSRIQLFVLTLAADALLQRKLLFIMMKIKTSMLTFFILVLCVTIMSSLWQMLNIMKFLNFNCTFFARLR